MVDPYYHSIESTSIHFVDWEKTASVIPKCPKCKNGNSQSDRTTYSKKKGTLFPIFGIANQPSWCIVQTYSCDNRGCPCKKIYGNVRDLFLSLPSHAADMYPVDPRYVQGRQHLDLATTTLMDEMMPTYGNGDLIARLVYRAINKSYLRKVENYCTLAIETKSRFPEASSSISGCYVRKDEDYIVRFPPIGDTIRRNYDEAASSCLNRYGISDHDRSAHKGDPICCLQQYICRRPHT